jgi:DNA processing protein
MRAAEQEVKECSGKGVQVVLPGDPRFPEMLKHIPDCPVLLFVVGSLPSAQQEKLRISIVGTRLATEGGLEFTQELSKELTSRGVIITSGLALGIDTAAHCGALRACAGSSNCYPGVAVLGSGVETVYPARNERLAAEIVRGGGAVVSEYGVRVRPRKHFFPERNRIISGMSHGTVIVEAKGRSGSLITARLALEQGRDVFAVPGEPRKAQAGGTNALLKQGATLIEGANDVFESFSWFDPDFFKSERVEVESETGTGEERVRSVLSRIDPCSCDALAGALDISVSELLQLVTALELKGVVFRHPGDLVSLSSFVDI